MNTITGIWKFQSLKGKQATAACPKNTPRIHGHKFQSLKGKQATTAAGYP